MDRGDLKPFGVTLRQAVERYIRHRTIEGHNPSSYWALKRWAIPALGELPLSAISADQIEESINIYAEKHDLSPASRLNFIHEISGLFNFGVRRDWVNSNPVVKIPRPRLDNARERWLRIHELERVLQHAPMWLKPIIRFSVATGMRFGEVTSLRGSSFFVDNEGQAYIRTGLTKNKTHLTWPLEGTIRNEIEQRAQDSGPEGRLFPGPLGGHPRASMKRHFRKAVEAAGFQWGRTKDGITWHSLRHSMASLALNSGVPEHVVQRMGNWKSREMVSRYAHLSDETLRAAASRMDRIVNHSR